MNKLISAFLSGLLFFTTACTGKYLSKDDYTASSRNMCEGSPAMALDNYPSGEKKSFIVAMEKTYLNLISGHYDVSALFKYRKIIDNQIKYQISREAKSFFYLHTPEGYYASEHEIIMMHILLSWGFSGQKKFEEAEVEARKAAVLFSRDLNDKGKFDDPLLRIMLAYVWTLCGNWDDARVDFRAAYKLNNYLLWAKKLSEMEKQPDNLFFVFGGPGVEPKWSDNSNNEMITGMKGLIFESKTERSELYIYDHYQKKIPLFITPDSSAWYKRHIERNNSIREFVQDLHYGKKVASQGTLSGIEILGAVSVGLLIMTGGLALSGGIIYIGILAESGEIIGAGFLPAIYAVKLGGAVMSDGYDDAVSQYKKNVDPANYYRYVRFLPEYMWVGWSYEKVNYPVQLIKKNQLIKILDSDNYNNSGNKVISAFYPDVSSKTLASYKSDHTSNTADLLHKAISINDNRRVEDLLQKGELIERHNEDDLTPLQFALKNKNAEAFKILSKYGADAYVSFDDGDSLVSKAARSMDSVYISILIENGINCNLYDKNGKTPLICAVEDYATESVKVLLSNKAAVNQRSKKENKTPLHYAVMSNNKDIVNLLVTFKADVSLKDSKGKTPSDYAKQYGFIEVYNIIQNVNKKSR
ncbi:MAG: ankyrin repeat domain-containing protein [Spirochaetes bacterium]|nr:ankyrin repeat domain-containing protein [Spirochaetota bacterium]